MFPVKNAIRACSCLCKVVYWFDLPGCCKVGLELNRLPVEEEF